MTTWFSADTHFGHENIIKYTNRPFKSVQEMDSELIRRWNYLVGPEDTVYHLGDFTLNGLDAFQSYAQELHGQLKIVPGSHDSRWLSKFDKHDPYNMTFHGYPIEVLPPLVSLKFPELGGKYPQVIVLCHYPMRTWDRSFHGSWMLFGHEHGRLLGQGLSFDVGVDTSRFEPISLAEVVTRMNGLREIAQRNPRLK